MLDYPSLFKKINFFKKYKHFLEIKILAETQEEYNLWKGHIETRLKKLTKFLEEPRYFQYIQVNPYPYPLEYKEDSFVCCFYYGISVIPDKE